MRAAAPTVSVGSRRVLTGRGPCEHVAHLEHHRIPAGWHSSWSLCKNTGVAQPLLRSYRRQLQADDQADLDEILCDVGNDTPASSAGATAGGDRQRLRGIPAIGPGVAGAIRGSRPGENLFRS